MNGYVLIGKHAVEQAAKNLDTSFDFIHFAAHGRTDENFPYNSAIVLTIPKSSPPLGSQKENGYLQAWEIFNLNIDAELVVLSACESASGPVMGGEGIIGLTRAFQYAGARSVVASLWSVDDAVTAAFMERFYLYLSQGQAKDEALRSAQLDLIRHPVEITYSDGNGGERKETIDASHPYYWAPFQLYGDWR